MSFKLKKEACVSLKLTLTLGVKNCIKQVKTHQTQNFTREAKIQSRLALNPRKIRALTYASI